MQGLQAAIALWNESNPTDLTHPPSQADAGGGSRYMQILRDLLHGRVTIIDNTNGEYRPVYDAHARKRRRREG